MDVMPVDITEIVAIIMGMSVVLIPVAGITARFALKPLVESLIRVFEVKGMEETLAITERRMALMEQQMEALEQQVHHLEETKRFDRRLEAGSEGGGSEPLPPAR
jgi:sensor histidine kinase YesM